VKLTDANSGIDVFIPASSIVGVRKDYPGSGQTWVETNMPATPVIQCTESAEEVERLRKAEQP
jgi:predicted ATP-grasp superfamily ATP-dependent carboligase